MQTVHIVQLYPKEMNIYGDNGNILVLKKRLEWRHVPVVIHHVGVGDTFPSKVHLIIGGGGQDKGQSVIADDLEHKASQLRQYADNGVPMLMICGMYQMFGHYFKTSEGNKIPGIGILDVHTIAEPGRIIGNIKAKNEQFGELIGYENHSGRTYLGATAKPFGNTKQSWGNNGKDGSEGAVYNNVIGSYLHGPLLAKSPQFTDYLLEIANQLAGNRDELVALNNDDEYAAAEVAKSRPR